MARSSTDAPDNDAAATGDTVAERSTATLTTVALPVRGRDRALSAGDTVDRYTVVERLGRGGMGVVYKAYDPELNRLIAVKLLRFRSGGDTAAGRGRERLLREAQALAQLSHPNVIAVFDAGDHDGAIFLAMELVQGQSLRAWLKDRPRSWREVLSVLCPAGRGLAAAHAAGLIHRDVKPANIMLGDDGRVRMIDFGLARSAEGIAHDLELPSGTEDSSAEMSEPLLDTPLTGRGVVVGTPPYMPPEQSDRTALDDRSDQFSFCVTLYEALYGVRPFAGDRAREVAAEVRAGRVIEPDDKPNVPAWLHRAVMRGLSADPADRFPDMNRLLAELTRDHARRRRRLAISGGVVAVAAIAAVLAFRAGDREPPCATAGVELGAAWNADARARIARAFEATGNPNAVETANRVGDALDAYAGRWVAMRTDACTDTHVHHSQSAQVLDARNACLDRRRSQLASLVEVFATTDDREVVDRAVQASLSLPSLAPCDHAVTLMAIDPAPADEAGRVAEIRGKLDRALALEAAGDYATGAELTEQAVAAARELGYEPLLAEALLRFGGLHDKNGQPEQAKQAWYEAARVATRARDDRIAARSWIELMWAIGFRESSSESALVMHEIARATLERIDAEPELRAHLENTLGVVYIAKGDYDAAIETLERALAMRTTALGEGDYTNAYVLDALGLASEYAGHLEDARRYAQRALDIRVARLGAEHPDIAFALTNLGEVYLKLQDYEAAEDYAHRALALRERLLGPEHPGLGAPLGTLASVAMERGKYAAAERYLDRAVAIYTAKLGADHPSLAAYYDRYGELYARTDQHQRAIESHRKVIELIEKAAGDDHPDIVVAMTKIGSSELALGQTDAALSTLEEAVRRAAADGVPSCSRADAQFALARALWTRTRDHARSLELARTARDGYRESRDPAGIRSRAEIDGWLAARQ